MAQTQDGAASPRQRRDLTTEALAAIVGKVRHAAGI